ncbi:Peptidoglycan D,D-transpeptidase MrdA [hydrothermal vent metagenome]|uniref:Peptidoglycan D,D-transpeptidase MrdA n=1 Tax=hydrothermal vent metagenome TaxID=652676 RepID=A0A3B1DZ01_9ZZZZ
MDISIFTNMRLKIIRLTIIGLFLLVTLDLFYVQVIRGKYFFKLSKNNSIRIVSLEGWRGRIKDRNGEILADNRTAYNVMVTPQDIIDIQKLFRFISRVTGVSQKKISRRYRQKKFTPFTPVVILEDVTRQTAITIEENTYRFPSLFIQKSFKRIYPLEGNSAHVLGYVGKISQAKKEKFKEYGYSPQSVVGYLGVEEYYDRYLKGEQGGLQIEVNSRGQQVRLLSLKEPTKGEDIQLTIDSRLQKIVQELLEGKLGAVVVMDMENGEILSMVSSPTYDPNVFVDMQKRKSATKLFKQASSPFMNRAIKGQFPPGSVFKVPVAIAALDSKKVTPYTSFICRGFYELGGIRFGCTHVHSAQNLIESLAHSCNIYYYRIGEKLGADKIYHYASLLGLGKLTGVDLPYEKAGFIPNRRKGLLSRRQWYAGDTLNFSIGQGDVLTTPLQLTLMMSTVAREGIEVQPHVIKNISGRKLDQSSFLQRIKIDKHIFQEIKKGLRATVTDYTGTAHAVNLNEIYVAGKTGTAQSSKDKEHHSWFVGYAKGEVRNIVFCIFLEHGGSSHNAVLLTRQLLLKMKQEKML